MSHPRAFAVIPAAGRSVRMGRPKLLLPWGTSTVIETVLQAWKQSRAAAFVVVVHPDDAELADVCRSQGAEVVVAETPPLEMKVSALLGLAWIQRQFQPNDDDAWLLAPADLPMLTSAVINAVIDMHCHRFAAGRIAPSANDAIPRIIVPTVSGKRGHPVVFPWPLAAEVHRLPKDSGVNWLLDQFPLVEIPIGEPTQLEDLDTPEDYRRLHNRYGWQNSQ